MATCEYCAGHAYPLMGCPGCGARGDGPDRESRVARALILALTARGLLRVVRRTNLVALVRLVSHELDVAGGDAPALHEALFALDEVEHLGVGVDELAELLAACEASADAQLEVALASGQRVLAPPGALAAVESPAGDAGEAELVLLFPHWLEVRTLPDLALARRIPLGALDGVADRISLSPSGRWAAVSYTAFARAGGYLLLCDRKDGRVTADPAGHAHAAGPVVFGEDETVYAYASIDPAWPEAVEQERAAEKPWKASFGSLAVGKIGGHGAGSWALWGALPEPGAPRAETAGLPAFREGRRIDLALPTGEVLTFDYATLFRVHAPNPKEFPALVKHRVRPRERTDAERAIEAQRWAPAEPFCAVWLAPGARALLVTRSRASIVSFPRGEELASGALLLPDGWPTELALRDDGRAAAVVWHRPTAFASGIELLALGADDPTSRFAEPPRQLFGRGRRFVHWMKRMQPMLIGPSAFGPDDQVAFPATFGGFWYDPTIDGVARRPLAGLAYVHTLAGAPPRRVHLHPTTDLPRDHDRAEDPDRAREISFLAPNALSIALPHGERIERSWDAADPPNDREPAYPSTIEPLPLLEQEETTAPVPVGISAGGAIGRFVVPGATRGLTASSAQLHPSGAYIALVFADPPPGGIHAGIFDTRQGRLVFAPPGALLLAWAVGLPTRQSETSRDVIIVTAERLQVWTLPQKDVSSFALGLEHPPRTLDVSPDARRAVLTSLDPHSCRATLRLVDPRAGELVCLTPETPVEPCVSAGFSPDGTWWCAWAPALSRTPGAEAPGVLGELWFLSASGALARSPVTRDQVPGLHREAADVRLSWSAEDAVTLELPGAGLRVSRPR